MTLRYSAKILNRYIAPALSEFTEASIPDLRQQYPDAPHWLAHHFLGSVFRGSFTGTFRQQVAGILRRAYHAFDHYHRARESTLQFLATSEPESPSFRKYFTTLEEWESFVLQTSMAIDLLRRLQGSDIFVKGDGSREDRLYLMANQIKHLASCTASGQMSDDDGPPLWLTNSGLASFGISLTYEEAGEILSDLAKVADELQDPKTFVEKSKAP